MVPEYEACFMDLLRYGPHLNTEKIKVNWFVLGLNGNLRAKVRIFMPRTLHNAVQKALIAEEELISGGQTRTPASPHSRGGAYQWGSDQDSSETSRAGFIWSTVAPDTSETYAGISWLPEGIHFHYTPMTTASIADTLSGTIALVAALLAAATV
jgi:hypothetical protein